MCYKFCCFGTSEPLALRPAARKKSSSIRLLLTSPSGTCHGSHIGPPVKTVLDTRELQPWKRAWISIVGSYKDRNSHWHGCNTAPSAPPSPIAVKHRSPVTSSPRPITSHSNPSSVSWLLSFVNIAVSFR